MPRAHDNNGTLLAVLVVIVILLPIELVHLQSRVHCKQWVKITIIVPNKSKHTFNLYTVHVLFGWVFVTRLLPFNQLLQNLLLIAKQWCIGVWLLKMQLVAAITNAAHKHHLLRQIRKLGLSTCTYIPLLSCQINVAISSCHFAIGSCRFAIGSCRFAIGTLHITRPTRSIYL